MSQANQCQVKLHRHALAYSWLRMPCGSALPGGRTMFAGHLDDSRRGPRA